MSYNSPPTAQGWDMARETPHAIEKYEYDLEIEI